MSSLWPSSRWRMFGGWWAQELVLDRFKDQGVAKARFNFLLFDLIMCFGKVCACV